MSLVTSSALAGKCPLCGADKHTCGGHPDVSPIDVPTQANKEPSMTEPQELQEYEYELHGNTTTGRLTEADAKRLDARPVSDADRSAPGKARKGAANKADTADGDK